jgi:hypothetical protein
MASSLDPLAYYKAREGENQVEVDQNQQKADDRKGEEK